MTTIPDIKSTYKTWFTWASLTPAQQAFATSQGYSSGSVSVAIGDVVDYVTQTAASTQTLLVDANGDPICNYGFNGVADILLDTTYNAGYVVGGKLRIPGVRVEHSSSIGGLPTTAVPGSSSYISTNYGPVIAVTNNSQHTRIYQIRTTLSCYVLDGANRVPKVVNTNLITTTGTTLLSVAGIATNGGSSNDTQFDHAIHSFAEIRLAPGQNFSIQQRSDVANGGSSGFTFNPTRIARMVLSWAEES